jgi:membrane protein involved in colicin uptake
LRSGLGDSGLNGRFQEKPEAPEDIGELAQLMEDSRRAVAALRKTGVEDVRLMVGKAEKRKADADAAKLAAEQEAARLRAAREAEAARRKAARVAEAARSNADDDAAQGKVGRVVTSWIQKLSE